MKKLFLALVLVALATITVVSKTYAGSPTADALGNPITLVDDTSIFTTFPSRLQTKGSAVFAGVSKGDTIWAGFLFNVSDMFDLFYNYHTLATITLPTYAVNTTLGGGNVVQPGELIYGMEFGNILPAIAYNLNITKTNSIIYDAAGDEKYLGNYALHSIKPGVTIKLGDSADVDVALGMGIQSVNNVISNITEFTYYEPATALKKMSAAAQLTLYPSDILRFGVRLKATHDNEGWTQYVLDGAGTNTNSRQDLTDSMKFTLGAKVTPVENLSVFLDLGVGFNGNSDINTTGLTPTNTPYTDSITWTLPSLSIGMEAIVKNWRFRGFYSIDVQLQQERDFTASQPDIQSSSSVVTKGGIGIGYIKIPWIIEAVINPDLFNNTIAMFSSGALNSVDWGADPIIKVQFVYAFGWPDKGLQEDTEIEQEPVGITTEDEVPTDSGMDNITAE